MSLSVAIISYNEEANIGRTLAAIKELATEIVLLDSSSTDNTVAIAKSFGATVYTEEWRGHIAQKNSALAKCSSDWILSLDCDEVVSPELIESIKNAMQSGKYNGYTLNRRTFYMGKLLKHSWQPDLKLRLVKRSAGAQWGGYDPHDVLSIEGQVGRLEGDLIHYSFRDFGDHMRRTIQHSRVAAASYHKKGKRASLAALIFKPLWVFFNRLIMKGGILDGTPGVMASFSSAVAVYMKYAFLWEMDHITLDDTQL
jgi:glycosyltransferase involved in cell wall biosynthesis